MDTNVAASDVSVLAFKKVGMNIDEKGVIYLLLLYKHVRRASTKVRRAPASADHAYRDLRPPLRFAHPQHRSTDLFLLLD